MHTRRLVRCTALLATLVAAPLAFADPPGAAAPPPPAHEAPRAIYRFEVSISGVEDGPHAAPATYTLLVQENQTATVSTGSNVPLSPAGAPGAAAPRQDVGLSLRLHYTLRGEVALLNGSVEVSSVAPGVAGAAATIRRMHVDCFTAVTPGTPALLASVYDIVSHRRYEINVTARRVL